MNKPFIDPKKIAIFYGAGISLPGPTNIPTAACLLNSLWDTLKGSIEERWESIHIPQAPCRWPQFEVVMEEMDKIRAGFLFKILKTFDRVSPNDNHYLIAKLGKAGCRLVTTNFDINVEKALELIGARPRSISSIEECKSVQQLKGCVPILKLHGCISKPRTIMCSVRDLARRGSEGSTIMMSPARLRALRSYLRDRICLVVGYSGSDRLDILPALKNMPNTIFLWAKHSRNDSFAPRRTLSALRKRSGYRKEWYDKAVNVGDTTRFLAMLASLCGLEVRYDGPLKIGDLSTVPITRACKQLSPRESILAAMRILKAGGENQKIRSLLREALEHNLPARDSLEFQINYIRLNYSGKREITELRNLYRRLRGPTSISIRAQFAYFLAYALEDSADYTESYREVKKAVRLARIAKQRQLELEALVLQALILARLKKKYAALKSYQKLIAPLKVRGSAATLAEVYNNAARLLIEMNQMPQAGRFIKHAIKLWELSERPEEYFTARLNEIALMFDVGKWEEASERLEEVIKKVKSYPIVLAFALLLRGRDSCINFRRYRKGMDDLITSLTLLNRHSPQDALLVDACNDASECLDALKKNIGGRVRMPRHLEMRSTRLKQLLDKVRKQMKPRGQ